MTDYTLLSNTAVGVGGLPSGATVTAFRDNPIAIAEGAPGAPRIYGLSIARFDRLGDITTATVAASDAFDAQVGMGAQIFNTSTGSASEVVAVRYTNAAYSGAMRFKCAHVRDGFSGSVTLRFYKNSILVSTFTNSTSTVTLRTVDSSVAVGDVFEWRHFSPDTISVLSSIGVYASDAFFEAIPVLLRSD